MRDRKDVQRIEQELKKLEEEKVSITVRFDDASLALDDIQNIPPVWRT